jgi:hypothetical protein
MWLYLKTTQVRSNLSSRSLPEARPKEKSSKVAKLYLRFKIKWTDVWKVFLENFLLYVKRLSAKKRTAAFIAKTTIVHVFAQGYTMQLVIGIPSFHGGLIYTYFISWPTIQTLKLISGSPRRLIGERNQ